MSILKEFICEEQKNFKVKIGKLLASSLSGFIAGVIFSSIFWLGVILFIEYFPIIRSAYPNLQ